MQIQAKHHETGEWLQWTIHQGRIAQVDRLAGPPDGCSPNLFLAPALFDLQINGCHGKAFVSPTLTVDDVRTVVAHCQQHGIAALCPTLITQGHEALMHGFATLRQACESDIELSEAMPCFHLEGPYISAEDGARGAHPREHVRPPDREEFERLQEAAGGRIRLVTLSPEYDSALPFITWLCEQNIVVAIGHTAASPQRIREAIRAGARLSTHLGNGSHAMLPRHENYLWEQLAADELIASFIPDGHHLPGPLLRCLIRVKGVQRLIITCDASSLAGLPIGRYNMWGQELEVLPHGKVVVPGTTFLAGSGVLTDACVRHLVRRGDVTLNEALTMATNNPRRLLDLPLAGLNEGDVANLILFEHEPGNEFRLVKTLVRGR